MNEYFEKLWKERFHYRAMLKFDWDGVHTVPHSSEAFSHWEYAYCDNKVKVRRPVYAGGDIGDWDDEWSGELDKDYPVYPKDMEQES